MSSAYKHLLLLVISFFVITNNAYANPFGGLDFAPGEMPEEWLFQPIDQIDFEDLFDGDFPFNLPAQSSVTKSPTNLIKPIYSKPVPKRYKKLGSIKQCASWNSFVTPGVHVLELSHFETATKTISYFFYNQEGELVSDGEVKIEPAKQRDVVLNDVLEKLPNHVGSVCVSGAEKINGRISVYKKDLSAQEADFTAVWPLSSGLKAKQTISLNTYFPYISLVQSSFVVANWIELTNLNSFSSSGVLTIFNQNGEIIERSSLTLQPLSRLDIPGHIIGSNSVGSATWVPDSEEDVFLFNSTRYYYNNSSFADSYLAATVINSSNLQHDFSTIIDNSSSSIIELVNPNAEEIKVKLKLNDIKDGSRSININIGGNGAIHLVAKELIPNGGNFFASSQSSFTSDLLSYSYNDQLELTGTASHGKLDESTSLLAASYNTFLNNKCNLRVFNNSPLDETVRVIMLRDSGRIILGDLFTISSEQSLTGEPFEIKANSALDIDLCQHEEANQVGTVSIFSDSGRSKLSATLTRKTATGSSAEFIKLTPPR